MLWDKRQLPQTYTSIFGLDPFADWFLDPQLGNLLPAGYGSPIPCIVGIEDETAFGQLGRIGFLPGLEPASDDDAAKVPGGGFVTAFIEQAELDRLGRGDDDNARLRDAPKIIALGSPVDRAPFEPLPPKGEPLPDPELEPPAGGWPPGTVIMAVIDDGIAFANERFRRAPAATRIQCFWQQDGAPRTPTVPFGIEHTKADIDLLLQQWTKGGSVDEAGLYRAAGLADFTRPGHKSAARRVAHGTHVLDLAAGGAPVDDDGKRPIIAVQLPTAATADTSFARLTPYVLAAIDYVLHRARLLVGDKQTVPVVLNISYGIFAGPHDGSHVLERAIDYRISSSAGTNLPLRVVLPAGNNHQGRHHAVLTFAGAGVVEELPWRVHPDDRTDSLVEIWLPHAPPAAPGQSRLELSLVTPDGLASPWLGEEDGWGVVLEDGAASLAAAVYRAVPAPTDRGVFLLALAPTTLLAPYPADHRPAPAGRWAIRLRNVSLPAAAEVQAWVQRDDNPLGFPPRGRQSFFDPGCYRRYDRQFRPIEDDDHPEQGPCNVVRRSLVNALATGSRPLVAGGYRRRSGKIAEYSAGGPTTPLAAQPADPAAQARPDVLLVSDDSRVLRGVLGAGTASGSRVAVAGTSVAAPQLARWLAGELAPPVPIDAAINAAINAAADATPPLPGPRAGAGRLERPPVNAAPRGRRGSHD